MGCVNACICGGICPGCSGYRPESYYGEVEDIAAQGKGYSNYDQQIQHECKEQK